jgi:ATP-dependent RNA helicase DDX23/PRP28
MQLDIRSHRLFNDRPFQLVCKTVISLVLQKQVCPASYFRQNTSTHTFISLGSGKTAAFVIPMLAFISKLPLFTDDNRHLGPYALIMAPTRELAQQIESEARKFASPLGFKCVSIVGGVSRPSLSITSS